MFEKVMYWSDLVQCIVRGGVSLFRYFRMSTYVSEIYIISNLAEGRP